jgi:hypothetical protein
MTLFDNMLELNNSFLLIALIIIAVICIYLLYSNLTKSGESAALKSGINALIQQNKKRDEIINFLLERVENLEHNVIPAQNLSVAQNSVENIPVMDDIDDVLSSVEQPILNTASAEEVEDILDSINTTENATYVTVEDNTHQIENQPTEQVIPEVVQVENTSTEIATGESNVSNTVSEQVSEFPELESEFEGLLTTSGVSSEPEATSGVSSEPEATSGVSSEPEATLGVSSEPEATSGVSSEPEATLGVSSEPEATLGVSSEPDVTLGTLSNDLVSALLDADEESLAGDHEFDLSTVPKGKDKLNAQYTVKQLKALSRQLKLKSKGNKTELINRIYEKLN